MILLKIRTALYITTQVNLVSVADIKKAAKFFIESSARIKN